MSPLLDPVRERATAAPVSILFERDDGHARARKRRLS